MHFSTLVLSVLVALGATRLSDGATLGVGTVLFFNASSCPVGFTALAIGNQGRVLVGASEGSTSGAMNSAASITAGVEPTHSHRGSATMCINPSSYKGTVQDCCQSNYMLQPNSGGFCNSNNAGETAPSVSGYPMMQLLACVSTATFAVPSGAVVMMNPGASASDVTRATSCSAGSSSGMSSWAPGVGRTLVAADPSKVSAPPFFVSSASGAFTHAHDVGSKMTVTMPSFQTAQYASANFVYAATSTVRGSTGASDLLPSTTATVCSATTSSGNTVPAGAQVFFAAAACPAGYSLVASSSYGRVAFSLRSGGVNGATFGSLTTLALATSGTGPVQHSHSGWSSAPEVRVAQTSGNWYRIVGSMSGGAKGVRINGLSSGAYTTWAAANSGNAVTGGVSGSLPYVGLLLCQVAAATAAPTQAPTPSLPSGLAGPFSTSQSFGSGGFCGVSSATTFTTWLTSVTTKSPVLYPRTDDDLRYILQQAYRYGCKVRVVGAGHSETGVVQQKDDGNGHIIVNLSQFENTSPWSGTVVPGGSVWDAAAAAVVAAPSAAPTPPSAYISAGASFLDLMALARPRGLVMPTQTAGFFFSIGGVVLNPSVHGGSFGQGRMNSLVMSLRVMLANGTATTISDATEVVAWRGSLGLLGIVTGVQLQLRQDTGFYMDSLTVNFDGLTPNSDGSVQTWSKQTVESHLNNVTRSYGSAEWFFNPFNNQIQVEVTDFSKAPGFDYAATGASYYAPLQATYAGSNSLAVTGARVSAGNAVFGVIISPNTLINLNRLVMTVGYKTTADAVATNSAQARDGYYLPPDSLIKFNQLYSWVKCVDAAGANTDCHSCGTTFKMVDATRTWMHNIIAKSSSTWFPTLPIEWRYVDVTAGTQLLEHLTPGRWIAMEIVNAWDATVEQAHLPYFLQLEQLWKASAPGPVAIHHGKSWGLDYSSYSATTPFPFQNQTVISSIYSTAIKSTWISKMRQYDPSGIFSSGAALQMLGLNTVGFDPIQTTTPSNVGSCTVNSQCAPVSGAEPQGCCCTNVNLCKVPTTQDLNSCSVVRVGLGQKCRMDCECQGGLTCAFSFALGTDGSLGFRCQ
jgi:hypothetical protein